MSAPRSLASGRRSLSFWYIERLGRIRVEQVVVSQSASSHQGPRTLEDVQCFNCHELRGLPCGQCRSRSSRGSTGSTAGAQSGKKASGNGRNKDAAQGRGRDRVPLRASSAATRSGVAHRRGRGSGVTQMRSRRYDVTECTWSTRTPSAAVLVRHRRRCGRDGSTAPVVQVAAADVAATSDRRGQEIDREAGTAESGRMHSVPDR